MKSNSVLNEEQRKALVSTARLEIVEALLHSEPRTVAALGAQLNRAPDSLYYHLKLLVKVGLLVESRAEGVAGRGEAVYRAAAGGFHSRCDPEDRESVETECAALGAMLRLTERTYGRALQDPKLRTHGKRRDLEARRTRVHLDAKARAELNRRVDELFDFLREHANSTKGRATSVTLVHCPSEMK